jgi:enoyl-CoA hydratase
MQPELLVTVDDGIMCLALNRPESRNAITRLMALAITNALDELDGNPDIRVAILTGSGGTFCSGMDLKAYLRGESALVEGRGFGGLCERPPVKPLIAAVEGYALAGGLELALCCDLIVAADNARFGIPEVKRGLAAGGGGLLRLPRQIPHRVAMEMALTGEQIPARRAYELGLINRIVPAGRALAEAHAMARSIAANAGIAVTCSKKVIVESREWPRDQMFTRQAPLLRPVFSSEDAKEGAAAFAEKRPPIWKNR